MPLQRFIILAAISLAIALSPAGCVPSAIQECVNGTLCPPGTECSGDGTACVTPGGCGNAILAATEECDDGNVNDGDGCNKQCRIEKCGDGNVTSSSGEVCDGGNVVGGDGCAANCKSLETCGNGIVDEKNGMKPEACDDGNTNDGDGCARDCLSFEICGNGVKNVGEECDDGNTVNEDECRNDCQGGFGCGNGLIDVDTDGKPIEECDDGDMLDDNECRNNCRAPRCGDGVKTTGDFYAEACDPGSAGQTAMCNFDCTVASCGDGKVNQAAGEQCDAGSAGNSLTGDCLAPDPSKLFPGCKLNVCGDGYKDSEGAAQEACDDGNNQNGDNCSKTCVIESCGNGILDPMEECDLEAQNSDTGACLASCKLAKCGDGKTRTGVEQCDDGNNLPGDGCSATCVSE
jgi:cysteine-rich repeat protein